MPDSSFVIAKVGSLKPRWCRPIGTGLRLMLLGTTTPVCLSAGMVAGLPSAWMWGIPLLAYFLLVPGSLLAALLRLKLESRLSWVLVSVSLGLATPMVVGVVLAVAAPVDLIPRPFERGWIFLWLNTLNVALWTICYLRGEATRAIGFLVPRRSDIRPLAIGTIPVLWAVASSEALNSSVGTLAGLSFFLAIVGYLAILLSVGHRQEGVMLGLVWGTALALLLQRSLLSAGLTGFDVNIEFFYASRVYSTGIWNLSGPGNINTVASINVLPVALADISGLPIILLFKTLFPILFSTVPLLLFQAFRRSLGIAGAAVAVLVFVGRFTFYTEMISLIRQQVAELFLALFIYALLAMGNRRDKSMMLMLACVGIVLSHYGVAYLFIFLVSVGYLALRLFRSSEPQAPNKIGISSTFLALVLVMTIAWNAFVAGGESFATLARISSFAGQSFFLDFFNPSLRDPYLVGGASLGTALGPAERVSLVLNLVVNAFIVVGLFVHSRRGSSLMRYRSPEFHACSIGSFALLAVATVVPYVSPGLNFSRIYHVALLFLAPYAILGYLALVDVTRSWTKSLRPATPDLPRRAARTALVLGLVTYFLLNSGVVYVFFGQGAQTISINPAIDYPSFSIAETEGASWTASHSSQPLLGDLYGRILLFEFAYGRVGLIDGNTTNVPPSNIIFLRSFNVVRGEIYQSAGAVAVSLAGSDLDVHVLSQMSQVYDNGYCRAHI